MGSGAKDSKRADSPVHRILEIVWLDHHPLHSEGGSDLPCAVCSGLPAREAFRIARKWLEARG